MWVDRHRPASLKEMAGNGGALREIERWIKGWKRGSKALLIWGPAGVGKTTAAHLLAEEDGREVVEMNASDLRNRAQVEAVLGSAAVQPSLFGGKGRLLLVDEVDGMSGKGRGGDYGGIGAVMDVIKRSAYPVVLTANKVILSEGSGAAAGDFVGKWALVFSKRMAGRKPAGRFEIFSFLKEVMKAENGGAPFNEKMLWAITYANLGKIEKEGIRPALEALPLKAGSNWWEWNGKLAPLRSSCITIEFRAPAKEEVAARLAEIAKEEGLSVSMGTLTDIAMRAGCDVRAAVTALEMISSGRKEITERDAEAVDNRRREMKTEEAVRLVLATTDPKVSRGAFRSVEIQPPEFLKYVDENIGGRYKRNAELAAAYRSLSDSDRIGGRIRATRSYGLLPFQIDLMTAGVSVSKDSRIAVEGRIVWPISRYSSSAAKEARLLRSIAGKVRKRFPLAKPRGMVPLLRSDRGLWDVFGFDEEERELLKKWR